MTVGEILSVVARRWYTSAVAIVLATLCTMAMVHDSGTYATRTVIEFRWPGASRIEPLNGFVDESVISFVGLVARQVNDGHEPQRYSTEEAPLYGAGRREADFVEAAFVGSQFTTAYPNAAIEVQVIGRDEDDVRVRQVALVDEVLRTAVQLQADAGAQRSDFIEQEVRPLSAAIDYITPSRLSQTTAFGAMVAAGVIVGVGSALLWERSTVRRRRRTTRNEKRA
ncbi:hypothetical protein [uncultured Microbacterium sp.]|uniref:hypothetical protein n=1 Tax=uncultured Microbacterium sp. TaxID=191216 RepID=UPI002638D6CB|nr:hypothetical protein [uncultured Microbacterium sp.]